MCIVLNFFFFRSRKVKIREVTLRYADKALFFKLPPSILSNVGTSLCCFQASQLNLDLRYGAANIVLDFWRAQHLCYSFIWAQHYSYSGHFLLSREFDSKVCHHGQTYADSWDNLPSRIGMANGDYHDRPALIGRLLYLLPFTHRFGFYSVTVHLREKYVQFVFEYAIRFLLQYGKGHHTGYGKRCFPEVSLQAVGTMNFDFPLLPMPWPKSANHMELLMAWGRSLLLLMVPRYWATYQLVLNEP